ncbi:Bug family tripartite tricarboxylate transporter substrate binding protein [Aliihoeflea sp. PC F10.4]
MTTSQHRAAMLKSATIGLLAACLLPVSAMAQTDYPTRPVTVMVPFPAGGTTDILGRIISAALGERLGQNVIVENRGGAGGNIGTGAVAQGEADGYTLVMGTVGTHAINASLYPDMPFDHIADFKPLSRVATVPNLLVANPNETYETVQDVIDYARENPGDIFYASSGNGTSIHLSAELFKVQADVDMTHIPYPGSGPAVVALMGNEVAIMFDNLPSSIEQVRSGALRPIAVTSAERSEALPDVPTIAESGLPDYEATSWFGLFAPAGTPDEIVEKLNATIVEALADPKVQEQLAQQGATPHPETPDEFAAFIETETAKWAEVVEVSGATID